MSDDVSDKNSPFDLERLQTLIEMMENHGLTEVSLRRGDEHWRLRRGPQEVVQMVPANAAVLPVAAVTPQSPVTDATNQASDGEGGDGLPLITSPTVGTYYEAASPEDAPFVKVGSKVKAETIVCVVEAMKVFNQIPSEMNGTIVEILVSNGDSVEFGQPLFKLQPG